MTGISHFIEHMLFKGTRRRSALQITKKTEEIGGQIDAFTTREQTCYYARVFEEHLEEAFAILGDLVSSPSFEREMIEREKRVVVEEIESYENNPEEQAHDLIAELVWNGHPLGRPILGTRPSLTRFGSRTLRRYHRERYTASNVLVAASGRVATERVVDLALRHLRLPAVASPNGNRPLPRFRSRAIGIPKDVTQSSLCLAARGPSYYQESRHALAVVNMILGAGLSSRLYQRIREDEGLAYSIYSFFDLMKDTGIFGIYLGVAPDNVKRSLALTSREIRRLKRDGVRRWELESAKAQLLMSQFLTYESTYDRMNRIAMHELCYGGQATLADVVRRVEAIDADEVQEVVESLFRPQRFSLVALGPREAERPGRGDWDF
ncbi:MAG: insulinase family protein [Candidatus Eisenbacteria bacterium]|nr:insulinase family protein [Candidatus Latescibacterota bacterium]MBD3303454.1 insulinase family protein [Candidatus Eisenbacteria bacterium]